jgi:hypothetical protein
MSSNSNSPVALAQLEKNINRYRRLSTSNPQFKNSLVSAEKRYENLSRTQRLRNVQRSVSPGTVRGILEKLDPGSPRGSPTNFSPISNSMGGRRRVRKTRRTRRRRSRKNVRL